MDDLIDRELNGESHKHNAIVPLPEDWSVQTVKTLRVFLQYGLSTKCDYDRHGHPVLRIPNIIDGRIDLGDLKWCELAEASVGSWLLERGDILFIRTNGVRERVGTCAVYEGQPSKALFASYLIRARLKPVILPSFFSYYFRTVAAREMLGGQASPAADGKFNINTPTLDSVLVPVPPIHEQRFIAAILRTVQHAIDTEAHMIARTRDLKLSVLQELFTRGLRDEPQKESELGSIPSSWNVVTLGETCHLESGGTPSKSDPAFWAGSIPWASPKDIKRPHLSDTLDHISQAGLSAGSKLVPENTVLIVIRGMILIRDVPVTITRVPMAFNQDLKAIVPGPTLYNDFLFYAIEKHKHRLFQQVGRSAHGTRTLLSHQLTSFLVPQPPIDEQREIVEILSTIDRKIDVHERKRATLQDLFNTLLHELMTGRIRVTDLDIDADAGTAPHKVEAS